MAEPVSQLLGWERATDLGAGAYSCLPLVLCGWGALQYAGFRHSTTVPFFLNIFEPQLYAFWPHAVISRVFHPPTATLYILMGTGAYNCLPLVLCGWGACQYASFRKSTTVPSGQNE